MQRIFQQMQMGICMLVASMGVVAMGNYRATDQAIQGYWSIRSSDSQMVGVMHLQVNAQTLMAYGMRVNVVNPKQKIHWTCEHGDPSLMHQAVWAGDVLLNMQRDDADPSFFYNGALRSAVGCVVLHPEIIFTSDKTATMTIPKAVDYLDFDKQFIMNSVYHLTKISRKQALAGCRHIITAKDRQKWGDLVHSPAARQAMLRDLRLTKRAWLQKANDFQICFDHR